MSIMNCLIIHMQMNILCLPCSSRFPSMAEKKKIQAWIFYRNIKKKVGKFQPSCYPRYSETPGDNESKVKIGFATYILQTLLSL